MKQTGFRPGGGFVDNLFTLRQIMEHRHAYRRPVIIIDLLPGGRLANMEYVDDIVLFGESAAELQDILSKLSESYLWDCVNAIFDYTSRIRWLPTWPRLQRPDFHTTPDFRTVVGL